MRTSKRPRQYWRAAVPYEGECSASRNDGLHETEPYEAVEEVSEFSKSMRLENAGVHKTTQFKQEGYSAQIVPKTLHKTSAAILGKKKNRSLIQASASGGTPSSTRRLFGETSDAFSSPSEDGMDEQSIPQQGASLAAVIEDVARHYPRVSTDALSTKDLLEAIRGVDLSGGIDCLQLAKDLEERSLTAQEVVFGMGLLMTKQSVELARDRAQMKRERAYNRKLLERLQSDMLLLRNELNIMKKGNRDATPAYTDGYLVFNSFNVAWLGALGDSLICRCEGKSYPEIDLLHEARRFIRPRSSGGNKAQQFLIHLFTAAIAEPILRTYTLATHKSKYEQLPEDIQQCVRKTYFAVFGILLQDDGSIRSLDSNAKNPEADFNVLDSFYYAKLETYLHNVRRKHSTHVPGGRNEYDDDESGDHISACDQVA